MFSLRQPECVISNDKCFASDIATLYVICLANTLILLTDMVTLSSARHHCARERLTSTHQKIRGLKNKSYEQRRADLHTRSLASRGVYATLLKTFKYMLGLVDSLSAATGICLIKTVKPETID